jgi:hypothetical protein
VQEIREDLEKKESEVRDLKKDLERQHIDIKSLEFRFAKIQKQSDTFQDSFTKKRVEFERATSLLTEANKAIKHKELLLKQQEAKIVELDKYVKQIKGLGQENTIEAAVPLDSSLFDDSLMKKLQ